MIALLAPGQGSQTEGMLSPWLDLPGAADRLAAWSKVSGLDLAVLATRAGLKVTVDQQYRLLTARGLDVSVD